ncbi:MAG: hypothetical protein KC636_30650 [Myxococcales bacterium]|nr:hypothetical protein [Myxococcales bacterium]
MAEAVEFGGHHVDFGDDGIIHWRTAEVIRHDDAIAFDQAMQRYQARFPEAVVLLELSRGTGVEANARRLIIEAVKERPYAICFINASFAMRAIVGLMLNASRLLGQVYPHTFVDTEDEARAWARAIKPGWLSRSRRGAR